MEQRSTKGSNNDVPGQAKSPLYDEKFLASFGLKLPEFESIPEMQSSKFTDMSSDFQRRADEMMAEARRESERMLAESRKWLEEGKLNLERARSEMDFKEYTDSQGYHVMEGRSKDGYVIIQKTKRNGTQFISEIEIYKDGNLTFRSNTSEDKFSYRDDKGKIVVAEKEKSYAQTGSGQRTVYQTSHATVYKRKKKKSTNTWKWLLFIGIAAAVIYFVFLR